MQKKSVNDTTATPASKPTDIKTGDLVVVKKDCPREELRGLVFFIHGKVPDVQNIPDNSGSVCISSPLQLSFSNYGYRTLMDKKRPYRVTIPLRWLTKVEDYE